MHEKEIHIMIVRFRYPLLNTARTEDFSLTTLSLASICGCGSGLPVRCSMRRSIRCTMESASRSCPVACNQRADSGIQHQDGNIEQGKTTQEEQVAPSHIS